MRRELFVLVSASAIALGAACSSSSTTTTNNGTDSGVTTHPATDDAGTGGGDTDSGGAGTDAGGDLDAGSVLNGCTTYVDDTAKAEVDLAWTLAVNSIPDHCAKIKVGTKVKWTGDFASHPLEALGGDTPNPITGGAPDGGSIIVTFPNPGLFGYDCTVHKSAMTGAFQVVP